VTLDHARVLLEERVEGWCTHLPRWVRWYFVLYLVLWTVSVSAALTSAVPGGAGFEKGCYVTVEPPGTD
jgi:hypothetical protein